MKQACLLHTMFFAATILSSTHSFAEGALAVGLPGDVAKDGFAYAYVNGRASEKEARAVALDTCRQPGPDKSKQARALCKVIITYHDQCVAVAEDPVAGTPGVGWAIADKLHAAEAQALSRCEETAGPGRRAACSINHSQCDGSAK